MKEQKWHITVLGLASFLIFGGLATILLSDWYFTKIIGSIMICSVIPYTVFIIPKIPLEMSGSHE